MKKPTYLTTEELVALTKAFLKQGKPIWEIAEHPLCPPNIAKKMRVLKQLLNPTKGKDQTNGS